MKLKYYLRGAGAGIIISVLILTIAGGDSTISDREIIERAKKLGMVEAESGSTIKDQMNQPSSTEASVTEASSTATGQTDSSAGSVEASSVAPSRPSSGDTPRNPELSTGTVKKTVTIYLEKGVSTQKVSEQLQRLEIIDNADFFSKYLINNGYADKLYVGECTFVKGMSRDDIINILINGNRN